LTGAQEAVAGMSDEKEIREVRNEEMRSEKTSKYKPLPRNKRTENDMLRIFEHGTEQELMQFLREKGLDEDSPRFSEILKLFRDRGGKRP
jgi:hypothetical protein